MHLQFKEHKESASHDTALFLLQFRQQGKDVFHLREYNRRPILFKVSGDLQVIYRGFYFMLFFFRSSLLMYFSEHQQCLLTILLEKEWELPSKCLFYGLSFFTRGKNCEEAPRERGRHGGQTGLCNLSRLLVTWFLLTVVKTGCFLPLPCKIPWPELSFCCCCLCMSLCC